MFAEPIVTRWSPCRRSIPPKDYHQNYLALHRTDPYIVFNDLPKLAALKQEFPSLYVAR